MPGQALGELRYLPTPIQRRPAAGAAAAPPAPPSANGITASENAAVARLSGGRVDLHAMGASVQRVPAGDPRLRAVGARSFAQGRQALVSSDADRGHEIWHLAQQAMGQVATDTTIGGQPVNTNDGLEREADRMGDAIAGFAGDVGAEASASLPAPAQTAGTAPLQRRVDSFGVDTENYSPPTSDLIDSIDDTYFTQAPKAVRNAINASLYDTKVSNTEVPTRITATLAADQAGDTAPTRATHKSGMVGKFGMNEFFMRSGGTWEVFEGGHLIPHEIWTTADPDVAFADDYVNLVPMSRNLNVGTDEDSWKSIEGRMVTAWKSPHGCLDLRRRDRHRARELRPELRLDRRPVRAHRQGKQGRDGHGDPLRMESDPPACRQSPPPRRPSTWETPWRTNCTIRSPPSPPGPIWSRR